MREIKFRIRAVEGIKSKKYIFRTFTFEEIAGSTGLTDWLKDKIFVGQDEWTGLKDKDGIEIYEGDIVLHTRYHMYAPDVSWHNQDLKNKVHIYWNDKKHAFWTDAYNETRCFASGSLNFEDDRADKVEIKLIGNIYNNPEILKEELSK